MSNLEQPKTTREGIKALRDLMTDIKFCMLTTFSSDSGLHSRPMTLQQTEFDGDLWFFTGKQTDLAHEIDRDARVNVTFSNPGDMTFISTAGLAQFVDNAAKKKELWHDMYEMWFPQGVDDPNLALLKVNVEAAEYWDSPHGPAKYLVGLVQTMTGKSPSAMGEHVVVK